MRHHSRCVMWAAPPDEKDWPNSLTDTVLDAPRGKMVVYRYGSSGGMANGMPLPVMAMAANVAARLNLPMVQWPDGPAQGVGQRARQWCYAIQVPS